MHYKGNPHRKCYRKVFKKDLDPHTTAYCVPEDIFIKNSNVSVVRPFSSRFDVAHGRYDAIYYL